MFRQARNGAARRRGRCVTSSANNTSSRRSPAPEIPGAGSLASGDLAAERAPVVRAHYKGHQQAHDLATTAGLLRVPFRDLGCSDRRPLVPKGNSSKRGLINVALNGLVSTGVIAGFRTNYTTREEPDQVQITVTSPSGARQESIRAKVLQLSGRSAKARRSSSSQVVDSPPADEHPARSFESGGVAQTFTRGAADGSV